MFSRSGDIPTLSSLLGKRWDMGLGVLYTRPGLRPALPQPALAHGSLPGPLLSAHSAAWAWVRGLSSSHTGMEVIWSPTRVGAHTDIHVLLTSPSCPFSSPLKGVIFSLKLTCYHLPSLPWL